LQPGQTAQILVADKKIGIFGALHPKLASKFELNQPLFLFEIDLQALQMGKIAQFKALSKFPMVRRDLALVVPITVQSADLVSAIKQAAGENLIDLCVFDVYQGAGIADGHKSLAFGLTFQHLSKTLTDAEIDASLTAIIATCATKFNTYLRT